MVDSACLCREILEYTLQLRVPLNQLKKNFHTLFTHLPLATAKLIGVEGERSVHCWELPFLPDYRQSRLQQPEGQTSEKVPQMQVVRNKFTSKQRKHTHTKTCMKGFVVIQEKWEHCLLYSLYYFHGLFEQVLQLPCSSFSYRLLVMLTMCKCCSDISFILI